MSTFIIAEAGSNHNKNFKQAIALIDVAIKAKADACKFQTYSSETLYSKFTPDFAGHKNIPELIKNIEIPREWQKDLKQYCDEKNIEFMSTPFDEKAIDELVNLGVKRLKIAGFEATDFRFVDLVASTKLPIIISLGIGFKEEFLDRLLNITSKYGNNLTLLHCNNAYPTPPIDVDLLTIKKLQSITDCKVGFSDHTTSTLTPSLAVALGASVIEKHFTLSKYLPGPDHSFALEPNELKEMIYFIRQTELMLTPQTKTVSDSEKFEEKAMRSVVAKKVIKIGELLTVDNITTKRPFLENNIPASKFEEIIGKTAVKNYEEDEFI